MIRRALRLAGALFGSVLFAAPPAAETPLSVVRAATEKVLAIVTDPALKGDAFKQERRRRILQAAEDRFDWEALARRALARNWRKASSSQRKEFTDLFRKLIEDTYLQRVDGYSGEKVEYLGERVEGDTAVVEVRIVDRKGTQIPVTYRMRRKNGRWLVIDVTIEGVSLVNNYRSQFKAILRRSSFDELLNRLRQKVQGL